MKRCRSSRRGLSAAAAALLLTAPAAWAQFDPTVMPDQPAQPAAPEPPAVEQAPLGGPAPDDDAALPAQGIHQQGLDTLDPSSPGILTEANGGFPRSMWEGSDRRALVALLPRMPIGKGSPAMRSLAERLLLSEAQVPQGASKNVYDVFGARIDRLATAGYGGEVADLFRRVPEKISDSRLTHARTDALLLSGDGQAACDEALAANQRSEEDSWLPMVAYCKQLQGDAAGAGFTADLLRETGMDDADFFALLAALGQPAEARGALALQNDRPLTPLRLVMLKAVGGEISPVTLEGAGPMVLVAVAKDRDLPGDIKLEAAERAARAGAIGARDLAASYASVTLNAPDLADPVTAAAAQPGGRGNALLYQAALRAPDPAARLAILRAAWARAKADGTYLLAARVNAEAAASLLAAVEPPRAAPAETETAPTPDGQPLPEADVPSAPDALAMPAELLAGAPDVVRALLAAGEIEAARDWAARLRAQAEGGDAQAASMLGALWPLLVVADPDQAFDEQALDAWWQGQADLDGADRSRRGALLMAVLEALGHPAPASFWTGLYDGAEAAGGVTPPLPVWRGLTAAGDAGRLGETVMLSLVAIGDGGPASVNPAVLGDVIRALVKVRLDRDARAVGLEALVAAGL